jgi:hypothetical protein
MLLRGCVLDSFSFQALIHLSYWACTILTKRATDSLDTVGLQIEERDQILGMSLSVCMDSNNASRATDVLRKTKPWLVELIEKHRGLHELRLNEIDLESRDLPYKSK